MKRWFKYIKPYWVYFVLGPLCMIVEVIGEVFIPKLYSQIINNGVNNQNVGYIVGMAALMVGVSVLMLLGGVGGAYFGAKASVNFGADLRQDLYNKVQKYSFANIFCFSVTRTHLLSKNTYASTLLDSRLPPDRKEVNKYHNLC